MQENYLKSELYNLVKTDSMIFEFIQSGVLDGIWYWDLEHPENEWMSPKFWETLGYDPNEKKHLASEWQNIIFLEDLKECIENFEKHCADPNHPYDQIVRYHHKNNSTVWIRCRGLAIRDKNGKAIRMLGSHLNITNIKETEQEISRLSEEYEIVFNGTQDAIFLIKVFGNGEFRFIRTNLAHQRKSGILLKQIKDTSPQELLGKEMGDLIASNYQKCIDSRIRVTYEEELNLPGGTYIWATTLTPIIEDDIVPYIVGSSTDITERKLLESKLHKHANYDELTELPNRRFFFERLSQEIGKRKRDNSKVALLYIDLDGFKDINDTYGHKTGDEVLIVVGNRLIACIEKSAFVARLGGDEFAIILTNIEDISYVQMIAKKIHHSLHRSMYIGTIKCLINSSIGITIYPDDGKDSETLLKNADSAIYQIKKGGKGGFVFSKDLL